MNTHKATELGSSGKCNIISATTHTSTTVFQTHMRLIQTFYDDALTVAASCTERPRLRLVPSDTCSPDSMVLYTIRPDLHA